MKKSNQDHVPHNAAIDEAFQKIKAQKTDKENRNKDLFEEARREIKKFIGNPKYIKALNARRYSFDECVRFIKEKYSAKEITFAECLDYIPNTYNPIEACMTASDPVSYLTEGAVGKADLRSTLLLPASCEQNSKGATKKNGCVLLLSEEDETLYYWWIGGNKKDYSFLYKQELYILADRT